VSLLSFVFGLLRQNIEYSIIIGVRYDSKPANAPFIFLGKEFFPFEKIGYILQRISYFPPDPAAGETFPR